MTFSTGVWMLAVGLAAYGTIFIGAVAQAAYARYRKIDLKAEAFDNDNAAMLMRYFGFATGCIIATFGAWHPMNISVMSDAANLVVSFAAAIIALMASQVVNDKAILWHVDNDSAVRSGNLAIGITEAATFIATALIFAGSMYVLEHGTFFNVVSFFVGQGFLLAIVRGYEFLLPRIYENVKEGSAGCALSLSGVIVASGFALGTLLAKPMAAWTGVFDMALTIGWWLVIMAGFNYALHKTFVSFERLTSELTADNSWVPGLIHAAFNVGATYAIFTVLN